MKSFKKRSLKNKKTTTYFYNFNIFEEIITILISGKDQYM